MGVGKKEGGGCFWGGVDTPMHTMTYFWCMPELKIGLADVSQLSFDHFSYSSKQRNK